MRFTRNQIASIAASAPRVGSQRSTRSDISRLTEKLRRRIQADIDGHMQPWMVLLDESVRFFIYLERYQFTRKLQAGTSPFAMQISRLRSDAISIRELIALGQEAPAHTVTRSFVDGIELAMALADDPEFAIAYFDADDDTEFWRKQIGFGRIYPRVERFLRRAGGTDAQVEELISTHKRVKDDLAGHVHAAPHTALRSSLAPSIAHPGMLELGGLGALSIHLPHLCMLVANETHTFAAACINTFVRLNPPPALAAYAPTKKLQDVLTSAHVLQELLHRHGDQLYERSQALFDRLDEDAS